MKQIIPSDFRHSIASKLKNLLAKIKEINFSGLMKNLSEKLGRLVPDKVKSLIPAKYHKWAVLALALLLILLLVCCFRGCAAGEAAADPIVCTVSAENLNVHKNFDADSSVDAQLPKGLEIQIVEQKTADGIQWGRIEAMKLSDGTKVKGGWINLEYVRLPGEPDPDATEIIPTEPVTEPEAVVLPDPKLGITTMGTVITGKLNIRKGAGSKYDAFDAYYEGDRIEIQEIITVDDTQWGRTGKGWIGMGYVRLDGTAPADGEGGDAEKVVSDGKHKVLGYGVVDLGELNVRQGPGTEYEKVDTVFEGVRYAYYQTQGDWIRIENGWISNEYFYIEGTTAMDAVSGIITTDDLNVRTGPGTTFKSVATAKNGDAVKILGQVNGWGYTQNGWVNMTHVKITFTTGAGTVTTGLNIRKEPDPASDQVGTYSEGDHVTIVEVSGEWGRTDLGWINLNYVSLS